MPQLASILAEKLAAISPSLLAASLACPMPPLGDGPIDRSLAEQLDPLTEPISPAGQSFAASGLISPAALSLLWLLAGDLDKSHTMSQSMPSAEGSFLHGIMHRREGDFGNAKYWMAKVGSPKFVTAIVETVDGYGSPAKFVDRCRDARPGQQDAAIEIQWIEWQCLACHLFGVEPPRIEELIGNNPDRN